MPPPASGHLFLILLLKQVPGRSSFDREVQKNSYHGTCNSWCRAIGRLEVINWAGLRNKKPREGKGKGSRGLGDSVAAAQGRRD